jgi:hypothetical protein
MRSPIPSEERKVPPQFGPIRQTADNPKLCGKRLIVLNSLYHLFDARTHHRRSPHQQSWQQIKKRSSWRHSIIAQPDHAIGHERMRASFGRMIRDRIAAREQ